MYVLIEHGGPLFADVHQSEGCEAGVLSAFRTVYIDVFARSLGVCAIAESYNGANPSPVKTSN
jgi:hypothetical protein